MSTDDISVYSASHAPVVICVTSGGATTLSKLGVQFLGLGYCTEQNTDGILSFVDCSLLRNGNHILHQKSWGGPSNFFFGGGSGPSPHLAVVVPLVTSKPVLCVFFIEPTAVLTVLS